jgi:hypothetical protein
MQVIRYFLSIIFITIFGYVNAIPKYEIIRFNDNEKIFEINQNSKAIFFFCPVNSINEESYIEKFNLLYRKKKIQSIDSLAFNIVFFQTSTNRSKGLKVKINGYESLVYINDFSCIFQNFSQRELVIHASRNEMLKYYITEFYNGTSSVNVKLKEDIACYSSLAERIPNYENYISQLFKPVYSELELIQSLKDSLGLANQHIKELQNSLKSQSEDLSNFKERIEQLEKTSKNQQPIDNKPQGLLRNFLIRSKNE